MGKKLIFTVKQLVIGIIALNNFYGSSQLAVSKESLKLSDGYYYHNSNLFTGKVYDYYSNGSLKSMHNIVNGIYDGKVEFYYENKDFKKSDFIDTALISESRTKLERVNTQLLEANSQAKELVLKKSNFINLKFKNVGKFQKLLDKGASGKLKGKNWLIYNEYKAIEQQISINAGLKGSYSLELKKIAEFIKAEEVKPLYIPKISSEYFYSKGKKTGLSKSFFTSGNQMFKENFIDGVLDGEWNSYYDGGEIKEKKQYSLSKLQGECISYFETGVIKEKKQYSNDILEGDYVLNYDNGNKKIVGIYRNNQMNEVWTYYYANGGIEASLKFKNGDGGNPGASGIPKNGRDGTCKFYYPNGKLKELSEMSNGKYIGAYKSYYENGKLKEQGHADKNGAIILDKKFNQDGSVFKSEWFVKQDQYTNAKEIFSLAKCNSFSMPIFKIWGQSGYYRWNLFKITGDYLFFSESQMSRYAFAVWYVKINGVNQEFLSKYENVCLLPNNILEALKLGTEVTLRIGNNPTYFTISLEGFNEALNVLK